jgi:hypothetical protein
VNTVASQYVIPDGAAITVNNANAMFANLLSGMHISLTKTNGVITTVSASDVNSDLSATFIAYDAAAHTILVKVGTTYSNYKVTDATVLDFPVNTTLSNLATNSPVTLTFKNGNLITIHSN